MLVALRFFVNVMFLESFRKRNRSSFSIYSFAKRSCVWPLPNMNQILQDIAKKVLVLVYLCLMGASASLIFRFLLKRELETKL